VATAAGSGGMVGGQALDMEYTARSGVNFEELRAMHAMKTGALITASCVAGALLAGAEPPLVRRAREYGVNVGAAFQIADDILDVVGDTKTLGKPAGSDERQGKTTYPSLLGLDKLILGSNYAGIALTGLCVAMAATGYGLLIAVYFKTPQQALSFGSISVVILAAIGGVWVPVFIMPEIMQTISPYSPLNWGLTAFNDLFLRNAPTAVILPELCKLLLFSLTTLVMSILIFKSRTVS